MAVAIALGIALIIDSPGHGTPAENTEEEVEQTAQVNRHPTAATAPVIGGLPGHHGHDGRDDNHQKHDEIDHQGHRDPRLVDHGKNPPQPSQPFTAALSRGFFPATHQSLAKVINQIAVFAHLQAANVFVKQRLHRTAALINGETGHRRRFRQRKMILALL